MVAMSVADENVFDPDLARKPQIVALNKIDLDDVMARWPKIQSELKQHLARRGKGVNVDAELFAISAATGKDVRRLLYRAAQLLQEAPAAVQSAEIPVYRPESDPKAFSIVQTTDGWKVRGQAIERAASMTYWEHYESVRRFQRILETLGVDQALRQAGVQNGDTVMVGDFELEWQD